MIPVELLLQAYSQGIFPMSMENGEISWFSPDPRGIVPLETFHIPHGLARTLKKSLFQIRFDHDFEAVMRACAEREETWISEEIIQSYVALHRLGYAHSVEAWSANGLAGGLYGVHLRGAFFGESMFHRDTDASKVALVALVQHLREHRFTLLDTQWITPHLATFGAVNVSKKTYLSRLRNAMQLDCEF